jgi:hypothetical protein
MRISGPNKYVKLFLADLAASEGTVKDFIERYKGSRVMRQLIRFLYPNIKLEV